MCTVENWRDESVSGVILCEHYQEPKTRLHLPECHTLLKGMMINFLDNKVFFSTPSDKPTPMVASLLKLSNNN